MKKIQFKTYEPLGENQEELSFRQTLIRHRWFRILMGVLYGALFGLIYWEFVGCNGGTCPLTSNPYKTVGIFALLGGLMRSEKKGIGCC